MRSDAAKTGASQAPHRSLFNALGYTKEELARPMIGIVCSYNEIVSSVATDFFIKLQEHIINNMKTINAKDDICFFGGR